MSKIKSTYTVTGMDCADCALHVENSVKKIPGISDVKVNLFSGTLELSHSSDKSIDSNVASVVKSAGYKILQPGHISSIFKIDKTYSQNQIRETIKTFDSDSGITKVSYDWKESRVIVNHTIPVPQLLSKLEDTEIDFTFIGTHKESKESSRLELPRIIFCLIFLTAGMILLQFAGFEISAKSSLLLAVLTGGYPIAIKGWTELRSAKPGMNLLMGVAVIGAVVLGEWTEAAMVVFLFALAQYLESWSMGRARKSIGNLMEERPVTARIVNGEETHIIAVEMVNLGDIIAVKAGERIPTDGIVVSGESHIDQSMITGESMPVRVVVDSLVHAGTLNKNGYLKFKVTKTFPDSTYSKITQLVTDAQTQKAPRQQFVEKFAGYYTPIIMTIAAMIAVLPPVLFHLSWHEWIYRALVLLVIACPCAFVISTPVSIISGLTNAIRKGIMIKGGLFLENFSKIDTIAFDKTGTLTKGMPEVQKVISLKNHDKKDILSIAASLEIHSNHPLASAIVTYAEKHGITTKRTEDVNTITGSGIMGKSGGDEILIGSHRMFEENGICNDDIHELITSIEDENHTTVLVGKNNQIIGIIAIGDELRAESASVIQEMKELGVKKILMLTGDNHQTAETIAKFADIDEVHSELLPEDKLRIIKEIRENNGTVAMLGDGINDAPALAAADIGIAMGVRGSDTALETADIALMDDDLQKIPFLRLLSNKTLRIVKQNIFIALFLKFVFLGLALPGYATLWMAVFADMGASLIVIFNGLRILKIKR